MKKNRERRAGGEAGGSEDLSGCGEREEQMQSPAKNTKQTAWQGLGPACVLTLSEEES